MFGDLITEVRRYHDEKENFTDHSDWEDLISSAKKVAHLDQRIKTEIESCSDYHRHKDFEDLLEFCSELILRHNPRVILDRVKFIDSTFYNKVIWDGKAFTITIKINDHDIIMSGNLHYWNTENFNIKVGKKFEDTVNWNNMRDLDDLFKSKVALSEICRVIRKKFKIC